MIRLDSQIFAPLTDEIKEAIRESLAEREKPASFLKEAYKSIYELAGADADEEFVFTSSGAESVSHVLFSAYVNVTRRNGKNHFLCGSIDEAPALMGLSRMKELGCIFHTIPADEQGIIQPKAVVESLSPRTALLSLSWVNGLTGVMQPIEEIAKICKERGVLFHVEATHLIGKRESLFKECGADFLTFNGEAFHAPAGTGGLFIRKNSEISSFIAGGPEQAHLRGGAFNLALFMGFAKAASLAKRNMDHLTMETARLKWEFERRILEKIPDSRILFEDCERACHITSFAFAGVHSEALFYLLSQKGIHACMGGGHLQFFPNILKACKVGDPLCYTALSFGFSYQTTEEEVCRASDLVAECVQKLRKLSASFKETLSWD